MALVRLIAALLLLWPSLAMAQVQQSGTVTPGHPTMWTTDGVVQDAGTSSQGKLTTLGITSSNLQSQCINNGPATGPYNSLCFGINGTQAQITLSSFGGAPSIPLTCLINGLTSNCLTTSGSYLPLSGGTLTGPLILSGDPTLSLGAATKHYVDNSLPVGGPFLPLGGGTLTGPLSITGPNGTTTNPGLQIYPTLHADGITSDDVNLQAAINKCSANGGTIFLPPGRILLTGVAGNINMKNCALVGAGIPTGTNPTSTPYYGTEIDLTSTTVIPFIISEGWSWSGINFYWPNQTGPTPVVYPPLAQDDGGHSAGDFFLQNVNIINAYDGIVQSSTSAGWGRFYVVGGFQFAVHDMYRLRNIGDANHLTSIHFTPGAWLDRCTVSGTTPLGCKQAIDAAAAGNTIFHAVGTGAVGIFLNNSGAFDWRYGVLVDSGASWGQTDLEVSWDAIGTIVDSSSGGTYKLQNTLQGIGTQNCGFAYSYVTNTDIAYYPCFKIGGSSYLRISNGTWASKGDGIDMTTGGVLKLSDATIFTGSSTNNGGNVYGVNAAGNAQIFIDNSILIGVAADTGAHGMVSTDNPTRLSITNSQFGNFNDDINTFTSTTTIIANNWSFNTAGANSVILQDTAHPFVWSGNQWDKPSSPVLANEVIGGNLQMNFPSGTGYVDLGIGTVMPPKNGTESAGTRIRFYNQSSPPDYSMGVSSGNLWLAVPSYSSQQFHAGNGLRFYGGTTPVTMFDNSGGVFSSSYVHSGLGVGAGSFNAGTVGAATNLDVGGSVVTGVALNAGGTGYLGTDVLADGYGGLYTITVSSGVVQTISFVTSPVRGSIVSGAAPCTTGCVLLGGNGTGATANLTWTAGTTMNIGPTAATNINLGNAGSTTKFLGSYTGTSKVTNVAWAQDYGIVGDGKDVIDTITIASGSASLSTTLSLFSSDDCNSGAGCTGPVDKAIGVWGAKATVNHNSILTTTITGFTSPTSVTLGTTATASVTAASAELRWGTDNEGAMQALMNSQAAGTVMGKVCFKDGLYMINGTPGVFQALPQHSPIVNPPNINAIGAAIVLFPDVGITSQPNISVEWEGCETPPPLNNVTTLGSGAIAPVNSGTIFTTTQAKVYTGSCPGTPPYNVGPQNQCYPAIFSGASADATYPFTLFNPVFRNITFRAYDDPQITMINCYLCAQVTLDRLWVDTGVSTAPTFPTNSDVGAFFLPKTFNGASVVASNIGISGFYVGITFADWAYMTNIQIAWVNRCYQAIGAASHKAVGIGLGCQRAVYGLYDNAAGPTAPMEIIGFDVEAQSSGAFATVDMLYDPNNFLVGDLTYHVGLGAWSQNGGVNMVVNPLNKKLTAGQTVGVVASGTTLKGTLTVPDIVSAADCTGQPTKSVISVTGTGVLMQCP